MEPEKSLEDGKIHKDNPAATGLSLSGEELERILKTGTGGLSEEEVRSRLQEYGFNDIPEEKKHPLLRFLRYFWGPIPWMIEVAALLSAIIQHWEDFGIIFLMLVINAVVGFFQERKAENAIELLKQRLAPNARVLRDGVWTEIPARGLVPGDIVHIRLGDIVPADVRLTHGKYLLLDESALTGESLPVEKKNGDDAYSGSIVRQGEMDAIVTGTGVRTFFGRTTRLLQQKPPRSHFQQAVVRIGNYLIALAVSLVSVVFIISTNPGGCNSRNTPVRPRPPRRRDTDRAPRRPDSFPCRRCYGPRKKRGDRQPFSVPLRRWPGWIFSVPIRPGR